MWTVDEVLGLTVSAFGELRAAGMSRAQIDAQLRAGTLVRARRDRYIRGDAPEAMIDALRLGGRLDCVSLLRELGIFVLASPSLHVHVRPHAARLPSRPKDAVAHWRASVAARHWPTVHVVEALVQAVQCQPPRAAVATLDSALHRGLIHSADLQRIFDLLPRQYRVLRRLVDGRSESRPESLVRLMLRMLGCRAELQVWVSGVGRVDLMVDGWLIVECDSRAYHSDWQQHREDRRRDRAAAEQGYSTLRLMAEDILYAPEVIAAALRGMLASPRRRRSRR